MEKNASPRPTADEVIDQLVEGNIRFLSCSLDHPNLCQESRHSLVHSQEPIATILTCADSRVPPVNIFDRGLGDLFVVRVAGNIVSDHVIGSIEYAVSHLKTPLVVVMGHSNCGAIDSVAKGVTLGGHMASLGPAIQEAIKNVQDNEGDLTNNAAKELAKLMAHRIRISEPIIADLVADEKVKVVAAYYDLESGFVDFF